jgi:hypothetical protein
MGPVSEGERTYQLRLVALSCTSQSPPACRLRAPRHCHWPSAGDNSSCSEQCRAVGHGFLSFVLAGASSSKKHPLIESQSAGGVWAGVQVTARRADVAVAKRGLDLG